MATLVYNPGQPDEKVFAIGEEALTIGRADEQGICIPHKSLSRGHARIEPAEGRFVVVDLGSKNGTHVNGVRVQRREIGHGDTITLGDLDLLFRVDRGPRNPLGADELRPHATRALLHVPLTRRGGAPGAERSSDDAERARRRLRLLTEVATLLPLSDDLEALLGRILELVFQILDVDRGVILLVDEKTGRLEPRVSRTAPGVAGSEPIYSQNIVDYVLANSVAALFTDAASDPRLDTAVSIAAQSIRASMCAPLKPRERVLGVLYVDNLRAAHPFSEDDLELFAAFAGQASVALENARLHRLLTHETVARVQLAMDAKLASLGALVAGIAHELRNPLNFINNFAELSGGIAGGIAAVVAEHGARIPADAREELADLVTDLEGNMSRIGEHGRRADAVIEGMLAHGRWSTRTREAADLNRVVAESVRLAREGAAGKGLEVRVTEAYDEALAPIEMAALDVGRVFLNVVDNALYAMRAKKQVLGAVYAPELVVSTAARGGVIEVRIRDNGVGMATNVVDKAFEPFFTTKPSGQGMGLGLSMSREIVVQGHQGAMRLESEEGEGTEVVVTLPGAR